MITALAILYTFGLVATSAAFVRMFWNDSEILGDEAGWVVVAFFAMCAIGWPVFWAWAVVVVWIDRDEE